MSLKRKRLNNDIIKRFIRRLNIKNDVIYHDTILYTLTPVHQI